MLAADLRVGIIGTDTSHATAFTKILNDPTAQDHVAGAHVVAAYQGGSADIEESRSRVEKYAAELPAFFIVSQVEIASGEIAGGSPAPGMEGLRIRAERAHGKKCERCWNYSTHVGESADYPTLCERCLKAIDEIERDGPIRAGSASL